MSQGPYRQTFAFKMRKSVRDARYRRKHHDEIMAKQRARRAGRA